jgi:hypothetical protein
MPQYLAQSQEKVLYRHQLPLRSRRTIVGGDQSLVQGSKNQHHPFLIPGMPRSFLRHWEQAELSLPSVLAIPLALQGTEYMPS